MSKLSPLIYPTLLDVLTICHSIPDDERDQVSALSGEEYSADELAHYLYGSRGPKWVAYHDNVPLVCAGFIQQRAGVYTAWFIAPEAAWKIAGKEITRQTRCVLRQMLSYGDGTSEKCHRVERSVLTSREGAKRWYGSIGLKFESTMPCYGANGETFDMYVATRDLEMI